MAQALAADTRAPGLEIRIAAADVDPLA